MPDIIFTKQNPDGSYSQAPNGVNGDIGALVQYGTELISGIEIIANGVRASVNELNLVSKSNEHANQRFWNAEFNRQDIINYEYMKYSNLKNQQDQLMSHINNANYPFGLWKFENLFYYRASPTSKLYKGNAETISEIISSNYPINVHIVSDLNNIPNNLKELKFDTTFLSIKSIISIEDETIDTTQEYEIFQDYQGRFHRNLIVNTGYLKKRFFNGFLKNNESQTKCFIQKMTTFKESQFLLNRLGKFFKSLRGDNLIVMVGNQDVSEGIFSEKVIRPMINLENYIIVTDDILKDLSIAEILKGKIVIFINHIPEKQEHREKLKELLIYVVINKSFQSENKTFLTHAQVIITIDKPNHFLKDFETLSDIFYINSIRNILSKLNIQNDVALTKVLRDSLMNFAEELVLIGETQWLNNQKSTDNEIFLLELDDVELVADVVSDTGLPILDPYSDTFETLLPKGEYHTYITGQTRIGKSFLLVTLFVWYMRNEHCSLILFDVHGDFAKKAKMLVKDKKRLLYISNSSHRKGYSATINLFEISDKSEKNIAKMANLILNVIKRVKSNEKFSGPMEVALLRSIRVLLRKGNGSFLELYRMMNDKRNPDLIEYAKKCGNQLDEEYFTDYFNDINTKNAIRKRLDTLINDEDFVNLTHGESKIDFEKEINTPGKIIIIDIAKGDMDSYIYYIRFMMEYILVLALKRFNTPKEDRTMTHVIIDEFDNFITAGDNIKTILKEAGKYNLFLTLAHQIISDIKDTSLRDTILSMTETKIVCRNFNKTLDAINKTHNINLEAENLNKAEQYIINGNNIVTKSKNTTRFLDTTEEISSEQWEEWERYQLNTYCRPINQNTSSQQPTEDDLMQMIQQFKNDVKSVLSSKISIESSSLNNLSKKHSEKFDEIKSDITYFDTNKGIARPRIRQQEISTIFQMVFGLSEAIFNRKFIALLKSENQDDLFNQTDSGTRLGDFTDNGKTQTEQYYYLTW